MHQLQVLPAHLTQRNPFADSIIAGQTVTEYEPQGRAAAEVDAVYSLILSMTQSLKTRRRYGQAKFATAA